MISTAANKGIEGWIGLAAAPAFGAMALLSHFGGSADLICSSSRFNGMPTMYLMMACVHLGPWLRLLRRNG